jgi:putative transposase
VKYAWITEHKKRWPISVTCAALEVSTSGYFESLRVAKTARLDPSPNTKARMSQTLLLTHIRAIHAEVKGEYGWPKVHKALRDKGFKIGRERVRKCMQQAGIRARCRRKFVMTTDSKHKLPIAENLLGRNFTVAAPNQVWTTDITYIATDEGWVYLAAMIDLHSRMVVGWSMQAHMQASLVTDALRMGYFRRKPLAGLIVHSDRGSQYCGDAFQGALRDYGMRSSMSRRGNCWDNAPTESLWGHLKVSRLHGKKFATRRQAMDEVIDWLMFYNSTRLHQTLDYVSPMVFEQQWWAKQNQDKQVA